MILAVTGGRDYMPSEQEAVEFLKLWNRLGGTVLRHGCCPAAKTKPTDGVPFAMRGVDLWAEWWGTGNPRAWWPRLAPVGLADLSLPRIERFPPLQLTIGWPGCGPERNRRMVTGADALIAFKGGRGTANCIKQARGLGIEVYFVGRGE